MRAFMTAGGDLLVPHDAGCGAELIEPGDPRYAEYAADAIPESFFAPAPEEDAALAAKWAAKWGIEERRTA